MRTEIYLTKKPKRKALSKELENEIKKAVFLALKEKGILTQKQCEECLKKLYTVPSKGGYPF
ncbi:MAG: hypothetical protein IJL87_00325 [Clostridia bacterium]|nr:hypothetical protein [Clostridia bacterium]